MMYAGEDTVVRTTGDDNSDFHEKVGPHLSSGLMKMTWK